MKTMNDLVRELTECTSNQVTFLQKINEALLRRYRLSYGGYLTVVPKEVELFYVNRKTRNPFVDTNMHCMIDIKTNDEIWAMQAGRFGKLYFHRKGTGGVDICLSDSNDYALCCTLKAAVVNGEECWSPLKVRNRILATICCHENLTFDMETGKRVMARMNEQDAVSVLYPCEEVLNGHVYHLHRRALRRRDKNAQLPLRSLIDIWNKKLQMGNVQRINLYMAAHPEEDILEVLRCNGFHYIPGEIRARYNLDKKAKL